MTDEEREEVVDGVVVLDAPRVVESRPMAGVLTPAVVQTVALVGVGMMAGATAAAVARRRKLRRLARRRRRVIAPVLASRSFLVDVHVLGERK
jgi:hypothetical protein